MPWSSSSFLRICLWKVSSSWPLLIVPLKVRKCHNIPSIFLSASEPCESRCCFIQNWSQHVISLIYILYRLVSKYRIYWSGTFPVVPQIELVCVKIVYTSSVCQRWLDSVYPLWIVVMNSVSLWSVNDDDFQCIHSNLKGLGQFLGAADSPVVVLFCLLYSRSQHQAPYIIWLKRTLSFSFCVHKSFRESIERLLNQQRTLKQKWF